MFDSNLLERLSTVANEHIKKSESFTELLREFKYSVDEMRHSQEQTYMHELKKLRLEMEQIRKDLQKYGLPQTSAYEIELNELRSLIDDPQWPVATPEDTICNDLLYVELRSQQHIDMFVCENYEGKKFLDFGCGLNFTPNMALAREASFALGYDIDPHANKYNHNHFTIKFEDVVAQGPYDIILMYDVLDHIIQADHVQIMKQIRDILTPKGRVYVKTHPWCSRHGGHIYTQKNKAFIHLIFDEIELMRMSGISSEPTLKITKPLETYGKWFTEAGFKIISEIPEINEVEKFFLTPSKVNDRLKRHWNDSTEMKNNMRITSVEYVLEHSQQEIF